MVGVPRTKRCQRCKRIKIKCDEKWPNCTPCIRARVACSGPPTMPKFIYNGSHANTDTSNADNVIRLDESLDPEAPSRAQGQGSRTMVDVRQRGLPDGSSFGYLRLVASSPRSVPTTVADRLAARLVGYLAKEDPTWSVMRCIGYTKHIPARLGESVALRDGVALLCSAWANYRRDVPARQVIDPVLYGRALRSLQRCLDDRRQYSTCETLAAATIMERVEVLFDTDRPYHRARHTLGIQGIMLTRGPPKLDDDLDFQLALENGPALISHWLVHGGENFYLAPPWREVMRAAMDKCIAAAPERRDMFAMSNYFAYWPAIAHGVRAAASSSSSMNALQQLRDWLTRLWRDIGATSAPVLRRAAAEGRLEELPDPQSPLAGGARLRFATFETLNVVTSHVMIAMVVNRALRHVASLLPLPSSFSASSSSASASPPSPPSPQPPPPPPPSSADLDAEHRALCVRTWMCIPSIRELGPAAAALLFTTPLYLSFEGAAAESQAERTYLVGFAAELAEARGRLPPGGRDALPALMMNTARAATGRRAFRLERGVVTWKDGREERGSE
ncbi:hypothetical protein F5X96DRAFT_600854 [Biscogniauxia mediterranea]|nr:hypothetical protein F5X96DRAFT_600854 [Biscogniauxia mediterranea]